VASLLDFVAEREAQSAGRELLAEDELASAQVRQRRADPRVLPGPAARDADLDLPEPFGLGG